MPVSREHFTDFLKQSGIEFVISEFKPEPPDGFTAKIRMKIDKIKYGSNYGAFCTDWLRKFSKFSRTVWNVRRTFPNIKRLAFKKRYVCTYSCHNKRRSKLAWKKNKECIAKIDFDVKNINQSTIKKDKLLSEGFNVDIGINFIHTHEVYIKEAFLYINCHPAIEAQFLKYFESGMTPKEAKVFHQIRIKSDIDAVDKIDNVETNPTKDHIRHMYSKWKADKAKKEENDGKITIEHSESNTSEDLDIEDSSDDETRPKPAFPNRGSGKTVSAEFLKALLDMQQSFCKFSSHMGMIRTSDSLTAIRNMTAILNSLEKPEDVYKLFSKQRKRPSAQKSVELNCHMPDFDITQEANINTVFVKIEKIDDDGHI